YSCSTLYVELRKAGIALVTDRQKISALSCARGSDFLKMNSEVEKEPSGFEIFGEDDGFALPKFDGMEILTGHQGFPESGKTTPLKDIVPGYTENDNQTGGASDQIEVSVDGGTVRKRKNSRGHCQRQHLKSHEFNHTGQKPFACRICGKSFAQSSDLFRHKLMHTGEKPFACRICGRSFARSSHLSMHKLMHTGEKPFACRICGRSFARSSHLSSHTLIHTGEKPFACRICGKSFAQSSNISTHKLTYTGEKLFACRICGKSFARSDSLSSHKLIHAGEKPFACRICGKAFADRSALARHKLIHTGERQFSCSPSTIRATSGVTNSSTKKRSASIARFMEMDFEASRNFTITESSTLKGFIPLSVCGKAFNHQSNLRRHEFIHKKEKRFHCSVYGDGFRSKSELHYHGKQHSEGIHSACALCDQPIQIVEDLEKHLKWHIESGYWQLSLQEISRKYTTFVTPREHFQFRCLPFGIANASEKFQAEVLENIPEFRCLPFGIANASENFQAEVLENIPEAMNHQGDVFIATIGDSEEHWMEVT
ncbi:unnamed protein product, partial [Cyprideis torosa]